MSLIVAVDFDGVIHNPDDRDEGRRMGRPYRGAEPALSWLHQAGAEIVVHTVRAAGPDGGEHVEHWLRYFGIPFDRVTALKPNADVFVDDRALKFVDWFTTGSVLAEMVLADMVGAHVEVA